MKFMISAAAALAVLGGSAAMAQPYNGYNAPAHRGYDARSYTPQQFSYGNAYGAGSYGGRGGYGYAAPWGGQAYGRAPGYAPGPAYGDRHVRRDAYRAGDRHMRMAPRAHSR
jgi:hypothetical protein